MEELYEFDMLEAGIAGFLCSHLGRPWGISNFSGFANAEVGMPAHYVVIVKLR